MDIQTLQHWVKEDWEKRSKISPTLELQLLYLLEEVGEVAEAIRKNSGAKARIDKSVDIGAEFADLVVSVITLANTYQVDLAAEIERFQKRLENRQKQGF